MYDSISSSGADVLETNILDFNSSLFDEILDRHEHRGNSYDAALALLKTCFPKGIDLYVDMQMCSIYIMADVWLY